MLMTPLAHQPEPQHLLNRELSWLDFNQRVLEEALDDSTPLLERLKFFCTFSSNLDEFFEVRVAGLKQQMESATAERSPDGLTATETLQAIHKRVRKLVERQYDCWQKEIRPQLDKNGIRFLGIDALSKADRQWVEEFYRAQVRPVLTPLGLDPAHPFPQLLHKSLNTIVQLEITEQGQVLRRLAVVQVPRVLPRLVQLPRTDSRQQHYLFLGDIVGHYLGDLFPETKILGHWNFRVTRNVGLYANEEEAAGLLRAVENELQTRRRGDAVRLEIEQGCPVEIRAVLLENLRLTAEDLYVINGPVNPVRLMAVAEGDHSPELREAPWVAPAPAALREETDFFAAIRRGDILLHHPYENFGTIVDFLKQAASDPKVLAIKQTLYRTGGDPQITGPLIEAVQNGKQVAAVVELKSASDETHGITWPRRMEEAGVHVVYGLLGCRIHANMCLVVRKDDDAIRRYLHISSGVYNPVMERTNSDVGLLTCRAAFAEDAASLFNLLTGICQFQGTKRFLVAPFDLHARMIRLIEREEENARQGLPSRIIARMNSLSDPQIIGALYEASRAGVQIDLIVRGICCLRPGVKGLSENITVRSIVDRFLEHSRIFYFENGCQPEVFIGSADWTSRSFFQRIELVCPIDDGNLRDRIRGELLEVALRDTAKARVLSSTGEWSRPKAAKPFRSQAEFLKRAEGAHAGRSFSRASHAKYKQFKLAPSPFAARSK